MADIVTIGTATIALELANVTSICEPLLVEVPDPNDTLPRISLPADNVGAGAAVPLAASALTVGAVPAWTE